MNTSVCDKMSRQSLPIYSCNLFTRIIRNSCGRLRLRWGDLEGFYAPFGEVLHEYNAYWMLDAIPRLLFNGKVLDEESGMYYYSARYFKPPMFISRDPHFEKYFWMSPYAYYANNPVKYIDPTGEEVEDTELYKTDKNGKLVNPEQVKAFEAFMGTEKGRAEIGKYAKAGQTIVGHTFEKDGEYHKAGVDIAFMGKGDIQFDQISGQAGANIVDGRLKIDISTNNLRNIGSGVETISHELLVHGRQYVKDYKDNKKFDFSHAYKELYNHAKKTGNLNAIYIHHWQELQSDKVMESTGIQILQQYYNNIDSPKSRSSLLLMIKFMP